MDNKSARPQLPPELRALSRIARSLALLSPSGIRWVWDWMKSHFHPDGTALDPLVTDWPATGTVVSKRPAVKRRAGGYPAGLGISRKEYMAMSKEEREILKAKVAGRTPLPTESPDPKEGAQ